MTSEQTILCMKKEVGETPLECLSRYRKDNPAFADVPMTYAGRLDPMASGLLLVLAGKITESYKKKLLSFDKTYEFEVLWGFGSDTGDVLGIAEKTGEKPIYHFDMKLPKLISDIEKIKTQEYPAYSSKPVDGTPLFAHARAGTLQDIEIPTRQVKIFSLEHIHTKEVSEKDVLQIIEERIGKVHGDFRQEQILTRWREVLPGADTVLISKIRATVSSGTYIRSLAQLMGKKLGCGGLACSIHRTRVGPYILQNAE